uniref:G_PROTEIN_RECEP_F1_2 domain-containing protein n=1 Tax=Panagrellus redivivus TaxID=6233 RepID=A0A7E4V8D1_PANRE
MSINNDALSSQYNILTLKVVNGFTYSVAGCTFLVAPFYIYAVVVKSSPAMRRYKYLLLVFTIFSGFVFLTITLFAPICKNNGYVLHGLLKEVDLYIFTLFAVGVVDAHIVTMDILLLMLINLYNRASKNLQLQPRYLVKSFHIFMLITSVCEIVVFSIWFTYSKMPWGLNVYFYFIEHVAPPVIGLYQLSRIILLVVVISLNNRFGRKLKEMKSVRAAEFHKMLARAINTSVVFIVLITRAPIAFVYVASFLKNVPLTDVVITVATCLQQTLMLGEMLITLYYIKPYRMFIVGLFNNEVAPVLIVSNTFE